jgi:hypothetical protein
VTLRSRTRRPLPAGPPPGGPGPPASAPAPWAPAGRRPRSRAAGAAAWRRHANRPDRFLCGSPGGGLPAASPLYCVRTYGVTQAREGAVSRDRGHIRRGVPSFSADWLLTRPSKSTAASLLNSQIARSLGWVGGQGTRASRIGPCRWMAQSGVAQVRADGSAAAPKAQAALPLAD